MEEGGQPAVGTALVAVTPGAEPVEILEVLVGESGEGPFGLLERLELGLVDLALLQVVGAEAQDLVVGGLEVDGQATGAGVPIDVDGAGEGDRRGEEPLLQEQGCHVLGAASSRSVGDGSVSTLCEREEALVCLGFVGRGGIAERLHLALLEPLGLSEIALQAPDGDLLESLRVHLVAPHESLRVDHLQQGGEGLGVPVVRSRRQEQPVLGLLGEVADGAGALGVNRVAPPLQADCVGARRATRRDVVGLVDDKDVEGEPFGRAAEGVPQLTLRPLAGQPGHGDDDPREEGEGVGVQSVAAPHSLHGVGVDDLEAEAELLVHLVLPLQTQAGGADDDGSARSVTQEQLLDDQASLDRLAQAHVIREK